MLKMFSVALLVIFACAGVANARGGGAESMPQTNFTDLPPYHPTGATPPLKKIKHACQHVRWHCHSAHTD